MITYWFFIISGGPLWSHWNLLFGFYSPKSCACCPKSLYCLLRAQRLSPDSWGFVLFEKGTRNLTKSLLIFLCISSVVDQKSFILVHKHHNTSRKRAKILLNQRGTAVIFLSLTTKHNKQDIQTAASNLHLYYFKFKVHFIMRSLNLFFLIWWLSIPYWLHL